jgi:hypothetical protein
MKVAIYHKTVPNLKNQEKIDLLRNFSTGITQNGDHVIDVSDFRYNATDVGVIQGWINTDISRPHLKLRNTVVEEQLKSGKYAVAVDSNLFLYNDTSNALHYLRYSFNGVFPSTGIYCDSKINPARWQKVSRDLNLSLKDYRTNGSHVLICMQRNGGWSMGRTDVQDWAIQTIAELRRYTDRPIVIRPHPGDKATKELLNSTNETNKLHGLNVTISSKPNLKDDLVNCWAVVNCNSSPVVGAAIEGYPIFVTDPDRSQCKEVANVNLADIENPLLPDRQKWVERLAMFHWNFDELKSGECWNHMRSFI